MNPWFWNPNRAGVTTAPAWFLAKLLELGEELAITWNPINQRWQLWARTNRVNHKICQGWRLLFIHNGPAGEHLPLDERIFARLYASSAAAHGSAKQYFERIMREMERDEERKQARLHQEAIDQAMPYFEHSQIKNIGKGNKFATYHS